MEQRWAYYKCNWFLHTDGESREDRTRSVRLFLHNRRLAWRASARNCRWCMKCERPTPKPTTTREPGVSCGPCGCSETEGPSAG